MYTDVMVDLETLGKRNDRKVPIASIGAVAFNLNDQDSWDTLDDGDRCFYELPELTAQTSRGLTPDADTITWWMTQNAQARQIFQTHQSGHATDPRMVYGMFHTFLQRNGAVRLWGNGNTFDNMILRNSFDAFGIELPIHWCADMDLRTAKMLAGGMKDFQIERGLEHHALDDAKYQVLVLQEAIRRIRGHG